MLDKIKSVLGSKAQQNRQQFIQGTVRPADTYGTSRAPQRQAHAIQHLKGYVYAAAMLNARSIASQPLRLYARIDARRRNTQSYKSINRSTEKYLKGDAKIRPAKSVMSGTNGGGELVEIFDHPILDLLQNVSPFIDGYQFNVLRKIMLQATGNEYLHPIIGPLGFPIELHVLPSQLVKIQPTRDERMIDSYQFGYAPDEQLFSTDEVLHNKTPSPTDPFYGEGWVEAAKSSAVLLESMDGYEQKLFENQARPDWGIFLKDNLNETQWNRMISYIDANLRGNHNSGRPYIFEGGSDARPLQFSPRDLAFSDGELRKVEAIAAISGVPVSLLRANDPNLASAEVGFASYMRDTIHPYLISDCEFLNQSLLPLFGELAEDTFLAYDNPIAEDEERTSRIYLAEVASGVRSINEARSELGLDPVDEGDELRVNGVPISQAGIPQVGQMAVEEKSEIVEPVSVDQLAEKVASIVHAKSISVREGSFVEWRTPKGEYLGKVERVQRSGDAEQVVGDSNEATDEDPVVHVRVFVRLEDGTYQRSDRSVAVALSRLRNAEEPDIAKGAKDVSAQVRDTLKEKVKDHNEDVGDAKSKQATLRMLVACYERGVGAYRTNPGSVRPTVSGEEQWAYGRVNGLLHALRTGKFKRKPYDTDLLPSSHPLSSKGEKAELQMEVEGDDGKVTQYGDVFTTKEEALVRADELGCSNVHEHDGEEFGVEGTVWMPCETHAEYERAISEASKKYESIDFKPPNDVQEEAERGLEWRAEFNRGGTEVGVARARDLKNGKNMSPDTIGRMVNYFSRHTADKKAEGFERGEEGFPSAGRIAWALWGGDPGERWANSIYDRMKSQDEQGEKALSAVKIKTCTGLEEGICVKSENLEDWHPTQKAARMLVEEVQDFSTPPADEGVDRPGEPKTPATHITESITTILESQRAKVIEAVKDISAKSVSQKALKRSDLAKILALIGTDTQTIADAVLGPITGALDAGAEYVATELKEVGNDALFQVVNEQAVQYARTHAASLAANLQEATVNSLRSVIGRGIDKGWSVEQFTESIMGNGRLFSPERAQVIARTETARAFNEGNLEVMRNVPSVAGKKWLKAPGACPYCVTASKQSEKNPMPLNKKFVVDMGTLKVKRVAVDSPPLHPNCRCGIRSVRREIK